MKELWLVRHGETTWNAEGRHQGQLNVPLSPRGVGQTFRLAERLRASGVTFDKLYSSDLERSQETARPIAQALDIPIYLDPRLREINSGALQGLLQSEIEERFPDYVRAVRADPWNTPRPQGESMADVSRRVEAFLNELPSGRFLIVTHGGVIRAALQLTLDLTGNIWRRFRIQNTSITRLVFPESRVRSLPDRVDRAPAPAEEGYAITVGDAAHLERWAEALTTDEIEAG